MKCLYAPRDLQQRLDQTFCRYNGQPVYVRYAPNEGDDILGLYTIGSSPDLIRFIRSDDELFDISTPPLGYCQVSSSRVLYVSRLPNRIYKQGISRDNIRAVAISNKITRQLKTPAFKMSSAAFRNTLGQNYPSIERAMATIRGSSEYIEIAVSNDVCVVYKPEVKSCLVYFKNEIVAWIPPNELKNRPRVVIKDGPNSWIIAEYLKSLEWDVQK